MALWIALGFTGVLALVILALTISFGLLRWQGVLRGTHQPIPGEVPTRWGLFAIGLALWLGTQVAAVAIVVTMVGSVEAMQAAIQEVRTMLAVSVGPWLVIIPCVALAGMLLPHKPWRRLGWKSVGFAHGALATPMIIPIVFCASIATQLVRYYMGASLDEAHPLIAGLENDPLLIAAMFLGVGVLVPIAEEIAFRGLLQGALTTSLARVANPMREASMRWLGIVITSVIFALIHPMFSWPAIFALALMLGYAYERSGSIWTPIVVHAAFNTFNLGIAVLMLQAGV